MAMAGKTWPPVPPPAINNFTDLAVRSSGHDISCPYLKSFPFVSAFARSFRPGLLRNIQEHARRQEHDEQTRAAVADKRQRDSLRGHHAEDDGKIDERLTKHHGSDAEREEAAEAVRRRKCRPQSAPAVNSEERDDDNGSDEAELFRDDGENKIGVRFGEIEKFLLAFHEADAGEASGTDSDERLRELKARALRVHVRMEKSQQAGLAVAGAHDEKKERGDRGGKTGGEPLPGKTGDKKYRGGDENDVHGCAEVRLQQNQRDANEDGADGGENVVDEIVLGKFQARGAFEF